LLRYVSALFSDSDDSEEEDMKEEKDLLLSSYYAVALSTHYLFHAGQYRTQGKQGTRLEWEKIVDGTKYNDEEFLGYFLVDREHFHALLDLICNHPSVSCRVQVTGSMVVWSFIC